MFIIYSKQDLRFQIWVESYEFVNFWEYIHTQHESEYSERERERRQQGERKLTTATTRMLVSTAIRRIRAIL